MKKKIDAVEAHFILCGYGRVGREAAAAIHGEDVDVVVVDSTEAAIAAAEEDGLLAIRNDATYIEARDRTCPGPYRGNRER